ncbi:MAG: hypothetical protein ACLQHK_12705 [Gallionellaceae bacterium]
MAVQSPLGPGQPGHAFQNKLKGYGMTCAMNRKQNRRADAPSESWLIAQQDEKLVA